MPRSLASHIIEALHARGVRRMFGVPGGGSSLSLIEAGAARGIEFVLARTETAAAIMAAVTAELTGAPGMVLTGIGPGAASAVNGIAYASLEKSPLLLITDCMHAQSSIHQVFDQQAVFGPLCKASARLSPQSADGLDNLLDTCLTRPFGPVHIDLSAPDATALVDVPVSSAHVSWTLSTDEVSRVRELLEDSRKPVLVIGLDARSAEGESAARQLASSLGCPALCTYKAKGIIADSDPLSAGLFTNATAEASVLNEADLIVTFGLDPIEMIPQAWRYAAPVVELAISPGHRMPFKPAAGICLPPAGLIEAVGPVLQRSSWTSAGIAAHRRSIIEAASLGPDTLNAQTVTQTVSQRMPAGTRLAVDAGAHMFAAMAFWQADGHTTVLKSNGLSTMGYALPAGIACALHEPGRPVTCITGDGGMSMCLGELATAAALGAPVICIVLNDAALSLIAIKQQRNQMHTLGTVYQPAGFARAASAFGVASFSVTTNEELRVAVGRALETGGPAVIDAKVDSSGYAAQLERLRG